MANKGKVLIVDDDLRLLKAYTVKLKNEGFEVKTEDDGTKAVSAVRSFKPDAILLDVLLPQKNGWDILLDLKSDDKLKDIPVIMVSNIGSSEKEIEAIDAGAAAYLVKSNTPLEILMQKIYSVMAM